MKEKTVKILKIIILIGFIAVIFLEALPYGVKMKWASETMSSTSYHAYFDTLPYGYGIFGPFLCSMLCVALFAVLFTELFIPLPHGVEIAITVTSVIATFLSITPIFWDAYTRIGSIISAILLVLTEGIIFVHKKIDR